MAFFEGCRVGVIPTGAGLVEGKVDQGPGPSKNFGSGGQGVGARAPRDGANFATCVIFVVLKGARKKGTTGAGLVRGGFGFGGGQRGGKG